MRGVEGLHITNNDLRGTGVTVDGVAPEWLIGIEFGCVYPYASDNTVGRSSFTGNRIARCPAQWAQWNYSGASYMTISDNIFDWDYNPAGLSDPSTLYHGTRFGGASISDSTFSGNTYVLDHSGQDNHPWHLMEDFAGDGNTFTDEHWTKSAGSIALVNFPFTDSVYTGCHFHFPTIVTFGWGRRVAAACSTTGRQEGHSYEHLRTHRPRDGVKRQPSQRQVGQ